MMLATNVIEPEKLKEHGLFLKINISFYEFLAIC